MRTICQIRLSRAHEREARDSEERREAEEEGGRRKAHIAASVLERIGC
jgi:hypothetical protein